MSYGIEQSGLADNEVCLLPPGSRTDKQFQADWKKLDELPELRKRLDSEIDATSDEKHPLNIKAKQMGFSHGDLMHPHLKGKELPRDLEVWGKRILAWVHLSVKIDTLEVLRKDLVAQARRRAYKSSLRLGLWTDLRVVGRKTWASFSF